MSKIEKVVVGKTSRPGGISFRRDSGGTTFLRVRCVFTRSVDGSIRIGTSRRSGRDSGVYLVWVHKRTGSIPQWGDPLERSSGRTCGLSVLCTRVPLSVTKYGTSYPIHHCDLVT